MPDFIPVKTREGAVKAAKNYLKTHKNLSGGNYYKLPDGTQLRVRKKEGGRLSAENYSTKTKADGNRNKSASQYTTDKARQNAASVRKQARQQSQSTLHQHAYAGQPSIAEHTPNIASGGIGDNQDSVSDPDFKRFKDRIESKIRHKYGSKYVVDINDVTGFLRVIPKTHHNQHQHTSQQPGYDVEPDMDIDRVVNALPILTKQDLTVSNTSFPDQSIASNTQLHTPPTSFNQPSALGGFDMSKKPRQSNTSTQLPAFSPPNVYDYNNGNGNGNGNGPSGSNGNGNGGDFSSVDDFDKFNQTYDLADQMWKTGKFVVQAGVGLGYAVLSLPNLLKGY